MKHDRTGAVSRRWLLGALTLVGAGLTACGGASSAPPHASGCAVANYPDPATSAYVLPWAVGQSFSTGLTNCDSSFHAEGQPDQMAFDFQMPVGTTFVAARAGNVSVVVDGEPSQGGGTGNLVAVDHGDGTSALYLHSPQNGIQVRVGERVEQGQVLGITGRSGLAGYPHLHFIVVTGSTDYPYQGVAVSFRNAAPADRILVSSRVYRAEPY